MALLRLSFSLGWRRGWEMPIAHSLLCRSFLDHPTWAPWAQAHHSLLRCFGLIQCSIRSGAIHVSKNSARKSSREVSELLWTLLQLAKENATGPARSLDLPELWRLA